MTVMRATQIFRAGEWPVSAARGAVTLDFADRHRRRMRLTLDEGGGDILLDLPRAVRLSDGDGLELSDGGWVLVRAACEDVIDIRAANAVDAMRLAWHLGNRHLPVQILPDGGLRILYDHVIEAMVRDLGGVMTRRHDIFAAEGGAYEGHGGASEIGHEHSHGNGQRHGQGHRRGTGQEAER